MTLKTAHKIMLTDSRNMSEISSASVDLMVTSPPYPMIEMWDQIFSKQNPAVGEALERGDALTAFEFMHLELDKVWKETYRVLKEGGFACINIGDATRTIGKNFRLFHNHSRIIQSCVELGFNPLPTILWRKQTNAPNKFMGSGMLPAGAYVTLEHEYILILRKGKKRVFSSDAEKRARQESAFFWEERNVWFSDIWEDLKGTKQNGIDKSIRERSGAFPFELPYRIINMYSLVGDTVLDPFLGTGTTTLAAMATGRNSIGIEIDNNFEAHLRSRFKDVVDDSNKLVEYRLLRHIDFLENRVKTKGTLGYTSKYYEFPVMTSQEVAIKLPELKRLIENKSSFEVEYQEPTFRYDGQTIRDRGKKITDWQQ